MTNETLAGYANFALYLAVAVLTLAMLSYAVYLARMVPAREEHADRRTKGAVRARESVAVGAGGPEVADTAATASDDAAAQAPATGLRARQAAGIGGALSWIGTALLGISSVLRGLSVDRPPLGNLFEFSVVGAFFTMAVFCLWTLRRDLRWLGLFVTAPLTLIRWLAATVWYTEAAVLVPSLKSYWLVVHVTVATLSIGIFIIGAVLSALYLARERAESKVADGAVDTSFWAKLPPSRSLEKLSYGLHIIAFPLWTFTVIAGAIWARQAWGSYWNWDPKEVWSFDIWVVYAAYLHARATKGASRRTANWIAIAGFACIVINYTVVNFYFIGQHSYA